MNEIYHFYNREKNENEIRKTLASSWGTMLRTDKFRICA